MNEIEWMRAVAKELIENSRSCKTDQVLTIDPAQAMELGLRLHYFLKDFAIDEVEDEIS